MSETYIPRDLNDCFVELKKIVSPEDLEKIKDEKEDDMVLYHGGLGMHLRNDWGLWAGSRLSEWFNKQGIEHPDDMSGIILDSFWRHLNSQPVLLNAQVEYYQKFWKEQEKKKNE